MENLTWTCHICKQERLDEKISVLIKSIIMNGQVCGEQNIRYCNDNPECFEKAQTFELFARAPS